MLKICGSAINELAHSRMAGPIGHGTGGSWGVTIALLVLVAGCLSQQVVLADNLAWHSRNQQQQHVSQAVPASEVPLAHARPPAAQLPVHHPGSGLAAAAPRPGSAKPQQVFGSDGSIISTLTADMPAQHAAGHRPKVPLLAVTVMSAVMALMSTLGVLPYFFCSKLSKPWAGVANAVASGVMLAASFGLLAEGAPYGGTYLILGMLLGVVFVKFSQEHLEQYEVDSFEQLAGADARKVILFLAVMAVHAVGEGGGVGVSFAGDRGWAQGTLVTLAIGLHNVPEGLAVATVMAAKGTSPRRTLLWTALTALPQALVAPPAFVFVDTFRALLPLAMGFAAGCMIWVVLAELLPDALEAVDSEKVATCATASAAWLQGLSIWIAHLETPAGTLASPFGNYTAVLPLGLTPLLPQLAPVVILPVLVAAAAARLSLPPVLLLAASAGLMGSYSAASWLQLLVSSPNRLLGGVLAPAVGAAVAAALWRQLHSWQQQHGWSPGLKAAQGSGTYHQYVCDGDAALIGSLPVRTSPDAELCCSEHSSNSSEDSSSSRDSSELLPKVPHGLHVPKAGGFLQQQQQQQQQHIGHHVLTNPAAPYAGHTHMRHQRSNESGPAAASAWAQDQHHAAGWHQQQQQQQQYSSAVAGASCWDQHSANGNSTCSSSSSPVRSASALHTSLLLPGKGDVLLNMGATAAAAEGRRFEPRHKRESWGFAGAAYSRVQGSGQAVAAASLLGAVGVAAAGVPLGLQLAAALTADPTDSGRVVVPMLLLGLVLVLGSLGFLRLLLSTRTRLLTAAAGLLSSLPVVVTFAALLSQPVWVGQGSARVAADGLQGLASGFNVFVLLLLLLPTVRRLGPKAAGVGMWVGAGAGLMLCACVAGMCFGTPYCLHVQAASSSS